MYNKTWQMPSFFGLEKYISILEAHLYMTLLEDFFVIEEEKRVACRNFNV